MEALDQARRAHPQLGRQRGEDLELGAGDDRAEPQFGRRAGHPRQEERLGFLAGHPGQPRPVAVDQPDAALRPALGIDRDAGRAERLDIAVDRPLGDLELAGELAGRQLAPRLEQQQHRDESGGAHPATIALFLPEVVMFRRSAAGRQVQMPPLNVSHLDGSPPW